MVKRVSAKKASNEAHQRASSSKDPYFSRATGKAFELLDVLGSEDRPWSLVELASAISLTKTSAFRLLHTLEQLQRIQKDAQGTYRLAARLKEGMLPDAFIERLCAAAAEPMHALSMEFRETISLAALMGNRVEVVAVLDSPHLVRMSNVVGRILPPHASSMGKAIAAFQSKEVRERLLVSYGTTIFTPHTLSDQRELEKYFETIRSTGISCDNEENTLGGVCYGAPIHAPGNQVHAAISISTPKPRLPREKTALDAMLRALVQAANMIGKNLSADN